MEPANIVEAAPTAIEATNPLNKVNSENEKEESVKMHKEEVEISVSSDHSDAEEDEDEGPMIDYPEPPRPTTTGGSRLLFVSNLSLDCQKSDIEEFFKEAGEVIDVRFAKSNGSFKGYGHIVFASSEQAEKALAFHGRTLRGRDIDLIVAYERPSDANPQQIR